MAYQRWIKKEGKLYGPYTYSSHKVDGKVVSEYHGRGEASSVKNNLWMWALIVGFAVLAIIFIYSVSPSLSGKTVSDGDLNSGDASSVASSDNAVSDSGGTSLAENPEGSTGSSESSDNGMNSDSESNTDNPASSADNGAEQGSEQPSEMPDEIIPEIPSETAEAPSENQSEVLPEVPAENQSEEISGEPIVNETQEIVINETGGNESEIAPVINESVVNETIIEPVVNISNESLINETVTNESIENLTVANETIAVNETNISIVTTHARIRLGVPVRWIKNVSISGNPESVVVELPASAENVSVVKISGETEQNIINNTKGNEIGNNISEHVNYNESSEEGGTITGQAVFSVSGNEKNEILGWLKGIINRIIMGITGRAVDVSESSDNVEVTITDNAMHYSIEYETPAPEAQETAIENGKQIVISAPDKLNYTDIIAYTYLEDGVGADEIHLYHVDNGTRESVVIDSYGYDVNGLVNYIEWNVPHLSSQTYELIIEITQAEELDENRTFIRDIYDLVKAQDDNWAEISDGHYARVKFERALGNGNDITLFARAGNELIQNPDNETGNLTEASNLTYSVGVYLEGSDEKIAEINNIGEAGTYKTILSGLNGSSERFDLRMNGDVDVDWIVDPIGAGGVNVWNCTTGTSPFSNVSCWSLGRLPLPDDDVIFNATGLASCNVTNGTMPQNLSSFTVDAGYKSKIYFQGLFANGTWGNNGGTQEWNVTNNINISGGVVYVYGDYPNNLTDWGSGQIWNSLQGNITIGTNGYINGIGTGFPTAVGPGYYRHGEAGAAHGGEGGTYGPNYGDRVYGNSTSPLELGSGSGYGDNGGGAIKLNAVDSVSIDGNISVNATMGGSRGGSAGSIWLRATTIYGGGRIEAGGGYGGLNCGGGGRIMFDFTNYMYTGFISTAGGQVSSGQCQAGTFAFLNNVWNGNWNFSNNDVFALAGGNYTINGNVVINNNTVLEVQAVNASANGTSATYGAGVVLNINGNLSIDSLGIIRGTIAGFWRDFGPSTVIAGGWGVGHGGMGAAFSGPSKAIYGDEKYPLELGSGGAVSTLCNGAGAVAIFTPSNIVIDGAIDMASRACGYTAGSGGSIWLSANTISGGGSINASGANSNAGAGGGRIALHAKTINFPGKIENRGGYTTGTWYPGGGGSIFINATSSITGFGIVNASGGYGGGNITINDTLLTLGGKFESLMCNAQAQYASKLNGTITTQYTNCSSDFTNGTFTPGRTDISDCYPAAINVYSPRNQSYNTTAISFNLTSNKNIDNWIANWNGTNYTLYSGALITALNQTANVEDGSQWLKIFARNSGGIWALNDSITFIVDTLWPRISYDANTPENNSFSGSGSIVVNISLTEENFVNITYRLYNATFGILNTSVFYTNVTVINWSGLTDRPYWYNVSATDVWGHVNKTETRRVYLDSVYPTIEWADGIEANDSYLNRTNIFVNVSAYDANEINITFELWNNTNLVNRTLYTNGYRWINWTGLNSNTNYYYNVSIYDIVPNINTTGLRKITFDNQMPNMTYAATGGFANGSYVPYNYIWVNVSLIENNVGNMSYSLYNSSGDLINSTRYDFRMTEFNWSGLSDGLYYYNGSVSDKVFFNGTLGRRNVTLDTTYPTIAYNSTTRDDDTSWNQNNIFVGLTLQEINTKNITFVLLDENFAFANTSTFNVNQSWINWTGLTTDRAYYYFVNISDKVNQTNSTEMRKITLDVTNPIVENLSNMIVNNSVGGSSALFNWTTSDNLDTNITCHLIYSGANESSSQNTFYVLNATNYTTYFDLPGGPHDMTVRCYDNANNSAVFTPSVHYLVAVINMSSPQLDSRTSRIVRKDSTTTFIVDEISGEDFLNTAYLEIKNSTDLLERVNIFTTNGAAKETYTFSNYLWQNYSYPFYASARVTVYNESVGVSQNVSKILTFAYLRETNTTALPSVTYAYPNVTFNFAGNKTLIEVIGDLDTLLYFDNLTIVYPNSSSTNLSYTGMLKDLPGNNFTNYINYTFVPDAEGDYILNATLMDYEGESTNWSVPFYAKSAAKNISINFSSNIVVKDIGNKRALFNGTNVIMLVPANGIYDAGFSREEFVFNFSSANLTESKLPILNYTNMDSIGFDAPADTRRVKMIGAEYNFTGNNSVQFLYDPVNHGDIFYGLGNETNLKVYWCQNLSDLGNCTLSMIRSAVDMTSHKLIFTLQNTSGLYMIIETATTKTVTQTQTVTTSGGSSTIYANLQIISPGKMSMSSKDHIIVPLRIRNPSTMTMSNIQLTGLPNATDLSVTFDTDTIASLNPGEEKVINMFVDSHSTPGDYQIDVTAKVQSPSITEHAFVYITLVENLNSALLTNRVVLVEDLFKENPECLELNDYLTEAESVVKTDPQKATDLVDYAISKCKDLITSQQTEPKTTLFALAQGGWQTPVILASILLAVSMAVIMWVLRASARAKARKALGITGKIKSRQKGFDWLSVFSKIGAKKKIVHHAAASRKENPFG